MIKGIGTDIIEIERVGKAIENESFLKKYFTDKEIENINLKKNRKEKAAGIFAAKEAVSKLFGTGFKGFAPKDIEILNNKEGMPYVILYNNAKKISVEKHIKVIYISISHCKDYAVAYAAAEGDYIL